MHVLLVSNSQQLVSFILSLQVKGSDNAMFYALESPPIAAKTPFFICHLSDRPVEEFDDVEFALVLDEGPLDPTFAPPPGDVEAPPVLAMLLWVSTSKVTLTGTDGSPAPDPVPKIFLSSTRIIFVYQRKKKPMRPIYY